MPSKKYTKAKSKSPQVQRVTFTVERSRVTITSNKPVPDEAVNFIRGWSQAMEAVAAHSVTPMKIRVIDRR